MAAGNAGGTAIVIKSKASIAIFPAETPRRIYSENDFIIFVYRMVSNKSIIGHFLAQQKFINFINLFLLFDNKHTPFSSTYNFS